MYYIPQKGISFPQTSSRTYLLLHYYSVNYAMASFLYCIEKITMKKIIYTLAIAFLIGSGSIYASSFSKNENAEITQQNKKKKVNEEDLPDAIKRLLKTETYKYWKVEEAFLIEGADYYKVELKKDDQKQTLNLDKYGNKVSVLE